MRVYEEGRRLLAEELGLEPSETMRRLQAALLADDPALAAPPRVPPRSPARGATPPPPALARRSRALLGVGGALLLAAALAVAALALTRDRTSAGIVAVGPNSLAAIDPGTNEVVAAIPVGTKPASVVSAHGSLWVANLDDETVSRVDAEAGRVVGTIPTGTAPLALAAGHGAIWAIGEDGIVLRINPAFNKVGRAGSRRSSPERSSPSRPRPRRSQRRPMPSGRSAGATSRRRASTASTRCPGAPHRSSSPASGPRRSRPGSATSG